MKRRQWLVLVAAILTCVVTARLGFWQLDRAAEKRAIQAAVERQSQGAPLGAHDWQMGTPGPAFEHRPVALSGRWVTEYTRYLDNRTMAGAVGFVVVTPLRLESGRLVVVQRGWIPRHRSDRLAIAPYRTDTGYVNVQGVLSLPPSQYFTLGEDQGEGAVVQNLNWSAYAQTLGEDIGAMSVKQLGDLSDGLLRNWDPIEAKVNTHYGYAVQWFALSALAALLYIWYQIWRPRRLRKQGINHG